MASQRAARSALERCRDGETGRQAPTAQGDGAVSTKCWQWPGQGVWEHRCARMRSEPLLRQLAAQGAGWSN